MENQSNISCEGHPAHGGASPLNENSDRMQSAENFVFSWRRDQGEIVFLEPQHAVQNIGYLQLCVLVISECIQSSS